LRAAHDVVAHCACERGCPACVGPAEEVGMLGKETALAVLTHFVQGGSFEPGELEPER
jgi:DEAD/DEAH box helicase domain-containing protein